MPITPDARLRPETAVAPPRARRIAVALGLASALTGGLLAAAPAPDASAAPAASAVVTAAKPHTTFTVSRKTMVKGMGSKRPAYQVRATTSSSSVAGRAKLVVNGKVVKTKKLSRGTATFRPTWDMGYRVGSNKIRVIIAPAASTGLASKSTNVRVVRGSTPSTGNAAVVRVAHQYIGARYSYGGTTPGGGFDCSGFTAYVYKKATGKHLPRSSSAQKSAGRVVPRSQARAGDIVWTPGHVAIYVGNGKVIEAARPGVGVVKRKMWQDNPRFVRI